MARFFIFLSGLNEAAESQGNNGNVWTDLHVDEKQRCDAAILTGKRIAYDFFKRHALLDRSIAKRVFNEIESVNFKKLQGRIISQEINIELVDGFYLRFKTRA